MALSLITLLHFLDDEEATRLVNVLVAALAPGSHLALTHATADLDGARLQAGVARYAAAGVIMHLRSAEQVAALVPAELKIQEPGLVQAHRWRPGGDDSFDGVADAEISMYAVVARKP